MARTDAFDRADVSSAVDPATRLEAMAPHNSCHQITGAAKPKQEDSIYKDTVNLPSTSFNMRANSVQREPQLQQFWQQAGIYEQLSRENPGAPFTLHDGPPYANGDLHIGHALNKILKDFVNKYQLLQGRKAKYVPGWDCHGLPIELKVLQTMSDEQRQQLTPIKLRRKARDFAIKTMKAQRDQFKRYGIWGDWDAPYMTLDPKYEAAQLRVFGKMVAGGHIYRGRKPVHWSPSSRTALAEAELEYPEGHTSQSIYVAMPIKAAGPNVPQELQEAVSGASLAIWTTTPWTIPANVAVALNADLQYAVVESEGKRLIVAEELLDTVFGKLEQGYSKVATLAGAALEGSTYSHPLEVYGRVSPVITGDHVTLEGGTGLVHSATGHGQEDYQIGLKYGLPILSPVDDAGLFTKEAGPFAGMPVLGEGNTAVIEALRDADALLKVEKYAHKYPYDWRTKQPTIFRATEQWFASVSGFSQDALSAINEVRWVPATAIHRISSMVEGRADWCISRQRKWGVPIPCFYYKDSGEALMTAELIEHIASVVGEKGGDAWWLLDIEDLLPPGLKAQADKLVKGQDTMDVWFDSGSSWAAVLEGDPASNYPADLYLEGSDQSRGWFQSSLLTAVAASGSAPYRQVVQHGFVLDSKGVKMSKSIGNVVDPRTVMLGGKDVKAEPPYGADVLRLWVASVDFTTDVLIGSNILDQVSDVYRKLRFTLRYLLGNLHDFDPARDAIPFAQLPAVDRYILGRFAAVVDDVRTAYEGYQFNRIYQALQRFAVVELSNFYLDVAKDRLYVRGASSPERRACQSVLHSLLAGLLPMLAPLVPHMAEDAWQCLRYTKPAESVFQAGWQPATQEWAALSEAEAATWRAVRAIRSQVNMVAEEARREKFLGGALEARLLLHVEDADLRQRIAALDSQQNGADPLRYLFIVSQARLVESAAEARGAEYSGSATLEEGGQVTVGLSRAEGHKCVRCWNYGHAVGADATHPELCERCLPVIVAMGDAASKPAGAAAKETASVA
ncbi:hypothetical protein WJX72_009336 [[Myrmecia] bisecta]|uniref:isoleucine--tRNA ligase n=1 Tax=[Myrmecia] bisecta TaxID=41462 RepID=A0AAW1PBU5_9CHLO